MKRNLATALLFCLCLSLALSSTTAHAQISTCGPVTCQAGATAMPSQGIAPLNVAFDAAPPSPTPTGLYWNFDHWDFGDGQTSTILQANHTYNAPGQYTAVATFLETGCSPYCTLNSGGVVDSTQFSVVVTVASSNLSLTPPHIDNDGRRYHHIETGGSSWKRHQWCILEHRR
jgi:hypothetical protein